MSSSDHAHDDMWQTPIPASTRTEDEAAEPVTPGRAVDEHAIEDTWYQVLRRKHTEDRDDE